MKIIDHKSAMGGWRQMALLLMTLSISPVFAEEQRASSAALFAEGMEWGDFLAATKIQRETWQTNAGRQISPALVERLKRAGQGLQLLVVTAEWCTDSVHSVPYLAQLAAAAGVELRVVDFKAGRPIMNIYKTPDGRASTPTVVLLRDDRDVAAWVEQPAPLQWWTLDVADDISKDELMQRKQSWYDWDRGSAALTEIVLLAERTAK